MGSGQTVAKKSNEILIWRKWREGCCQCNNEPYGTQFDTTDIPDEVLRAGVHRQDVVNAMTHVDANIQEKEQVLRHEWWYYLIMYGVMVILLLVAVAVEHAIIWLLVLLWFFGIIFAVIRDTCRTNNVRDEFILEANHWLAVNVNHRYRPYGILITIGDATKPQNMSTQSPFKHAPFNGRGGFWRTSALQQVGFDHRTVGEDHDAGYRGCAYFGFKGILDMNMLCQEQEPPDCKALPSQRIRWETAALEMRRPFSWILRSPHYGRFETFVLLWGQLQSNCNMPFQSLPFQVATSIPIVMLKSWLSIYALGNVNDANMSLQKLCSRDNCVITFEDFRNPVTGNHFNVALPLPVVIFAAMTIAFMLIKQLVTHQDLLQLLHFLASPHEDQQQRGSTIAANR